MPKKNGKTKYCNTLDKLAKMHNLLRQTFGIATVVFMPLMVSISHAQNSSSTPDVGATMVHSAVNDSWHIDKDFSITIPFEWAGGLPVVKVNIGGKEHKFLFDTAAPTIVPEELVSQLNLQPVGAPKKLYDSAGRELDKTLYRLPLLKVGDVAFRDFVVVTGDFKRNFPFSCLGFDGILGYTFFKDLNIKLDYSNQKITLSDNGIPHARSIPVEISFEPVRGPLIEANFPFGNAYFEIDTGKNAGIQLGDPAVIPEFEKMGYVSRETRGTFSSSIGGVNIDSLKVTYLAQNFSISPGLPIKSFPISVDKSGSFLVGNDFLKHFTIVLDFPNQKGTSVNSRFRLLRGGVDGFSPVPPDCFGS
ncbi:retropepsin-like aspartic protease [Profundibacter sp.]|uniref:retropepsin-like aspartic protease n=1 Tax=Profundibacter sp. TaxID=3101071 RepID=UPI003D13755C